VACSTDINKDSMLVRMDTGAGIISRHAEFYLQHFDLLLFDSMAQ